MWNEYCQLILGNRGFGKTLGLEVECDRVADERRYALVAFDLKGDFARRMVGHNCANGRERSTYLEIAKNPNLTLQWPFFNKPTAMGLLDREVEMNVAVQQFCQPFWSARSIKSGIDKPYTKKWMEVATRIWGSQPVLPPLTWLSRFFDPDAPERAIMLRNAVDRDAGREVALLDLRCKNPVQREVETGASGRNFAYLKSATLWTRHGNTDLWEKLLPAKSQVYFDLSGIDQQDARLLTIFACNAIIATCRAHFNATGKALPVVIVLEEAGFLDLVTPEIITSLQGDRAAGVVIWIASQTVHDFDAIVFEQLMGLTQIHRYYRMDSGIDRAASDLANPTYDPNEVHYTRERLIQDGVDEIKTTSTGKSKDHHGNEREDHRENTTFRPRYRTILDEFYKAPQVHEQEFRTGISRLVIGQRYTRDLEGVYKETVDPLEKNPWRLGLSEKRTMKAIERIRSRPVFQQPSLPLTRPAAPVQSTRKKRGVE